MMTSSEDPFLVLPRALPTLNPPLVAATDFEKEQRLFLLKQVGHLLSGPRSATRSPKEAASAWLVN